VELSDLRSLAASREAGHKGRRLAPFSHAANKADTLRAVLRLLLWTLHASWRLVLPEQQPDEPPTPEELWPAVAAAFEFVRPSYEQTLRRLEAQENRIRALMTFATAITFPVLTLLTGPVSKRDFGSYWFIAGVAAFVLLMIVGILSSVFETVQVVDPARLYNEMLMFTEWEFKKNVLYLAGQDFAANAKTLNWLGGAGNLMALLMAVEVICLVIWAIQTAPNVALPLI